MELRLLLADDFRLLADNKTLAVGLFPDSNVMVHAPQEVIDHLDAGPPLIVRLGFLACIMGLGPGAHKFALWFHAPDGSALPYRVEMERPGGEGGSVNLMVNLQMLEVRTSGVYTVHVAVDGGEPLKDSFTISVRPITPPGIAD